MQANVFEAKADFSKLIRLLESKQEQAIIVTRYGKPVVQITLYEEKPVSRRIGVAKGKFRSPKDFDRDNAEIADLLTEGTI